MKKFPRSIYLNNYLSEIINKSKILDNISFNQLGNWCISLSIENILKETDNEKSELAKYIQICKRQKNREIARALRKETLSKGYFLKRVIQSLRKMFDNNINKNVVIEVLIQYIEESKTYYSNDDTTRLLILWKDYLTKSKRDFNYLKEWFKIRIDEVDNSITENRRYDNGNKRNNKD